MKVYNINLNNKCIFYNDFYEKSASYLQEFCKYGLNLVKSKL